MTGEELVCELRSIVGQDMPVPGGGRTVERHFRLMALGKRDLSLARLAEAHYDAIAILAEANRTAENGKVYGVWASELPGKALRLSESSRGWRLNGQKMFCSGAGLIDKALVTVVQPEHHLVEVDLRAASNAMTIDGSDWSTQAFRETRTATVTFADVPIAQAGIIGGTAWYLQRTGFWHGACGPAACWAGGAEGLVDYARAHARTDAHSMAHLAAMHSDIWSLRAVLSTAGEEIDRESEDKVGAGKRALIVRHLVEQACSDILRRFARAMGPYPLAMDQQVSRRYHELDLYLRQSHAERDLESLGRLLVEGHN